MLATLAVNVRRVEPQASVPALAEEVRRLKIPLARFVMIDTAAVSHADSVIYRVLNLRNRQLLDLLLFRLCFQNSSPSFVSLVSSAGSNNVACAAWFL